MDYTRQNARFKIKKALRYLRIYGPRRTRIKVVGQYHMKKKYDVLPRLPSTLQSGGHVGLIGCGNFQFSVIAYYLKKNYGGVIRGAMDMDINKAASIYDEYGLRYYTDDADRIINDPEIELVYIASNHASHAEYAIEALKVGKSVHIEKPHVVGEDQLKRLCEAMTESKGRVSLGFNRPKSRIGKAIKYYLDTQSGPSMFNWFVAGHKIPPDHWYFKEQEGGRVLGNLCHWTDFVLQLVARKNRYPLTITPTRSERADCDIAVTYVFGDGSVAALTFSTKSEPFEGIRERFAAQRGEVLISMDDFKSLTVEVAHRKYKISPMFRDHGHELNVTNSYEMIRPRGDNEVAECPIDYVWDTGMLFLKTRQALEEDRRIVVHPFDPTLPLTSEKDDLAA